MGLLKREIRSLDVPKNNEDGGISSAGVEGLGFRV